MLLTGSRSEIISAREHLLAGGSQENGVFVLSHVGALDIHQASQPIKNMYVCISKTKIVSTIKIKVSKYVSFGYKE